METGDATRDDVPQHSDESDQNSQDNQDKGKDAIIETEKLGETNISDDDSDEEEFFDAADEIQEREEIINRTGDKEEKEQCVECKKEKDDDIESKDKFVNIETSEQSRTDEESDSKTDVNEVKSDEAQNDYAHGINDDIGNSTEEENSDATEQNKEEEKVCDDVNNDERTVTDSDGCSETEDLQLPDEKEDAENEEVKPKPKPSSLEEDEEGLTELEESMTDEEKENRKDEAQSLKTKGNELYKNEEYGEAIDAYSNALLTCPLCYKKERAIMYSNRAACHIKMEENEEAVVDCGKAIELHPVYIKAILRRAQTYEKLEKLDEALEDYKKLLELDPTMLVAREACMRLPEEIKVRNEKLKDEMMSKLKDLGNMVLRPFGLSTSNFQLQQDPNTGSYSVNFQQNPTNNGK